MNIVTPFPTNIPINTVNVTTELARRDNQMREMIAKPNATEAGVAERGVAGEQDKAKQSQQQQGAFDVNLRQAEAHQKIQERQGGQGQGGQDEQKEQEKKQQAQQQAQQRLDKAEKELQQKDNQEVQKLKARDLEVRTHEQAHAAVGGRYASSPTYEFKRGPDGRNYAVGGEVQIDISPVAGDPKATIEKMQQVRAAALAPAEPSGQDRKVAAQANQTISQARADQISQQAEEVKQAQAESAETPEQTTSQTQQTAEAAEAEPAVASQAQAARLDTQNLSQAEAFEALFGRDDNDAIRTNASAQAAGDDKSAIFGAAGLPGGERRDEVNANRAAAEQRNADVVARAGRIESFYARSTVPRPSGFSQFA